MANELPLINPLKQRSSARLITEGLIATSLTQLINFLVRIVLPPLFLHAWGVKGYANWLILFSLAAYLSLSNLGGQRFLTNHLTQCYSRNQLNQFRQSLNSGLALFVVLTLSMLIIVSTLIYYLPMQHILGTQAFSGSVIKWVLWLLAIQMLFSLIQGTLTDVYQSIGRQPFSIMLHNGMAFLQVLLCAIALSLKASPLWVMATQIIPVFLLIAFTLWDLPKQFDTRLFSRSVIDWKKARSFIKPSLSFFSIQLANAFSIQGTIIVLGMVVGSVQLIMFSTIRTIINTMKQLLTVFFTASWREMTHLDATTNTEKFRLLSRAILRSSLCAAVALATGLYFFAEPLYRIWLHQRVPFNASLMHAFLLYGLQSVFWTACANILMTINKTSRLASIFVVTAVINVVITATIAHLYDLEAAVIAMTIVEIALPCWFVPLLCRHYNPAFNFRFFSKELLPILICIITIPIFPMSAYLLLPLLALWWFKGLPIKALRRAH